MAHRISKAVVLSAVLLMPLFMSDAALRASAGPAPTIPTCADVALVLAVDGSASISPGEFVLQQQGIAAAFRDPAVQDALRQAGKVMVSAVYWGSESMAKQQSNWVTITGKDGAEQFARVIENMPRNVTGDTGLGAGLVTALSKITQPNVCASRRIINLSGDGEETRQVRGKRRSAPAPMVRNLAQELQVEINALAISDEEPDLAQYYTHNVITGPDAFVMEVRGYGGFADALKRKLIREISPRVVAAITPEPGLSRPN